MKTYDDFIERLDLDIDDVDDEYTYEDVDSEYCINIFNDFLYAYQSGEFKLRINDDRFKEMLKFIDLTKLSNKDMSIGGSWSLYIFDIIDRNPVKNITRNLNGDVIRQTEYDLFTTSDEILPLKRINGSKGKRVKYKFRDAIPNSQPRIYLDVFTVKKNVYFTYKGVNIRSPLAALTAKAYYSRNKDIRDFEEINKKFKLD